MPFGAELQTGGATRFRLWAPGAAGVDLEVENDSGRARMPMRALDAGWHELVAPGVPAGTRYRFVLPDGLSVPDPASRRNPLDVHGPSEVVDPLAYAWHDDDWRGRAWEEAVLYELHIGTFTPEGTFAAARGRLADLAELGITAVELMPVADFPGKRNWGYDGVLPYAPEASYGTPDDLKALVDAAHGLGLMVLLDVVYNHFGPEGNYLHTYCPQFFNPAHPTPWGAAINFDGEASRTVRDYFVHNALYWVGEYRLDGLRLDAVHAIRDESNPDIVSEIAHAIAEGPGRERRVHLVLENDRNESHYLERAAGHAPDCATAQWNDDLHHALHVLVAREVDGYYADYADAPVERLARALAEGFVYQGEASAFRGGAPRGEPSRHLPPAAFISFLQTHDQVGNRAYGERLDRLSDPAMLDAALACLLLAPQTPMLFMGEEFAASTPFLFFCDFGPDLAEAVSRGRREEFAQFAAFSDPVARARIPDPGDPASFERSKLAWFERDAPPHGTRLALVRKLLALRRRHLVPHLAGMTRGATYVVVNGAPHVEWTLGDGARWHLAVNLSRHDASLSEAPRGETVYSAGTFPEYGALRLAPAGIIVTLEPV